MAYGIMSGHDAFDVHGQERDEIVFLRQLADRLISHALCDLDKNRTEAQRRLALQWFLGTDYDYVCSFRSACALSGRDAKVLKRIALKAYQAELSISYNTARPKRGKIPCPFPGCEKFHIAKTDYCEYHSRIVNYRMKAYPDSPELWLIPVSRSTRGRLTLKKLKKRMEAAQC